MRRRLPLLLLVFFLLCSCSKENIPYEEVSEESSQTTLPFSSNSNSSSVVSSTPPATSPEKSEGTPSSHPDREEPSSPSVSASLSSSSDEVSDLQPEEKKVSMVFTFMDSNGFPLVDEEVAIRIVDSVMAPSYKIYENSVQRTDADGKIEVATGYCPSICVMELISFDHSRRPQPEGLGLGPLEFEHEITEFTDILQEGTFVIEVHPLEE